MLPFIFQEAKESIDEEDPMPTSSNRAYISTLTDHKQGNMYIKLQRRVQNHDILSAILGLKFKVLFSQKPSSIFIHEATTTSYVRHKLFFTNCDL